MTVQGASRTRDLWKVVFAWGALTLGLGIVMLARPGETVLAAAALLGTYLIASGIAEMALAFILDTTAGSRIPLFVTGALSLALGVLTFRHFGYAYAVLLLALGIGIGFFFEGVSEIALTIEHPSLPDRGWYAFLGVVSMIAGIVMLAWPFTSLRVAMIVAGVWLSVIGISDILWALRARRAHGRVQRTTQRLRTGPATPATQSGASA
ncbi:HdeD family acid-resistance protein [Mycobacterium sp.]|uniref:HdeD family acid-resistance protein n=1 Tax=Mycobacterium sp. TaxID=1785 RepID=UPI002C1DA3D9|nr:HdeD family acid-resistance protein [Mycobacterium sp.]HTY32975.1 HdeD family acid-resistance protein [Mycobacterium sp.]